MQGPLGLRDTPLAKRFQLERPLEPSHWGNVFLATDRETKRVCRVEVILRSGAVGADLDRRVAREVRIGRELAGQEGLIPAFAWGRLGDERVFVVREGAPARPLDLFAGALREQVERLLELTRRVEVLAALGIAHRDLGPHALVDGDEGLSLCGFALASLDGVHEPPPDPGGYHLTHLPSAAPEVIQAIDLGGTQADVYSLGALLQRVLSGAWPQPEDLGQVARWLVAQDYASLSEPIDGAPEALDAMRRQALSQDPDERPTATQFAEALEGWLEVASQRPELRERRFTSNLAGRLRPDKEFEEAPAPGPGDVLGSRFLLAEHLESSRLGEVHAGTDQVQQRPCRIELISLSGERTDRVDRMADREVRACLGIDSPGLLRAIAWGRLGPERLFVAREVVPDMRPIDLVGGSLEDRVTRLAAAARRLGALSRFGVVHRNVGLGTLWENPAGEIALSGFAHAKRDDVEEPEPGNAPYFSLPTVAPEGLLSASELGPRGDVYSLGALLYFAITGRFPFMGPTRFDLLEQHAAVRAGEVEPPEPRDRVRDVSPHLNILCRRALNLDPSKRPARANAFAFALEEWLGASELEAADHDPLESGDEFESDEELASASLERADRLDALASASSSEIDLGRAFADSGSGVDVLTTSSTSIVLREFPLSLLIPSEQAEPFGAYRFVCTRCEEQSHLLPPMTAETSRCAHCKKGPLRPADADAQAAGPSATIREPFNESGDELIVELPESLAAPAGLESALASFKVTCADCLERSYLVPPMTPHTTRCMFCAGALRPWRAGDDTPSQEDLLKSSAQDAGIPVKRRATGEARVARRVPKASKLVSMAQLKVECASCGEPTFVLPPETPETSECGACGSVLRPAGPLRPDRLLEALAAVGSASDSAFSLTTDGLSLEESDHGTGYVSWGRAVPEGAPTPVEPAPPPPPPPVEAVATPTPSTKPVAEAGPGKIVVRLAHAPGRKKASLKRRVSAAVGLALLLVAALGSAWHLWKLAVPSAPPAATPGD